MKQQEGKVKKQRQSTKTRTAKTACGTLSYRAECRGTMRKAGSMRGATPPDGNNMIVRT